MLFIYLDLRDRWRPILSPLRLPVPPSRHFVEVLTSKAVFLLFQIGAQGNPGEFIASHPKAPSLRDSTIHHSQMALLLHSPTVRLNIRPPLALAGNSPVRATLEEALRRELLHQNDLFLQHQ